MQSSMWSFLQKKEGGEIEDIKKKIDESSAKANELNNNNSNSNNKKKPASTNNSKSKDIKKSSNKKKLVKEDKDEEDEVIKSESEPEEEEEEEEEKEKVDDIKSKSKPTKSDKVKESKSKSKPTKSTSKDKKKDEDEMDLDENQKEKKKKANASNKESSKDKKKPQLQRLKRKTMDDKEEVEESQSNDLDDLLDSDNEKDVKPVTNDTTKESTTTPIEKKKEDIKPVKTVEPVTNDTTKESTTQPIEKKKELDINDLFKKAAEYSKSNNNNNNNSNNNNKKQKTQHKPASPVKSQQSINKTITTTTTTTTTTNTTKSDSPITINKPVSPVKSTTINKPDSPDKENNKTTKEEDDQQQEEEEEEELEEEIEIENELVEEEIEEYEEYEQESDGEEEEEEEKKDNKVKIKFIKKVPISKKKSTVKSIQNDLKNIAKYNPIDDAMWKKGESIPYMVLAKTFETIESYSSRLVIIEHLTNLFRSIMILSPKDLVMTIYLSINKIGPSYQAKELGIGDHILIKCVAEATGRTVEAIKQELVEVGDLGIIAQNARMTQPLMFAPPPLSILSVFKTFQQIADLSGTGGQKKKMDHIKKLLIACKDCESLYIIRSLQGKLRIGLAERSVLMALAKAVLVTPPSIEYPPKVLDIRKSMKAEEFEERYSSTVAKVTRAYSQLPNYDLFVPHLCELNGIDNILKTCSLKVGIPVKPMLAQPTTGITQMLDRFTDMEFTCEFKYDGERAQIHYLDDGSVHIYTRNLEDYTGKYPDIVANVKKFIGPNVKSFILDCEAVAFDPNTKKILSFQVLSTRARKSVQLEQIKVPVCVFAFDLLYLNGTSLIDEQFVKRREIMVENFVPSEGVFSFAKYANISDVNDIQSYLEEAVEGNCEGLMVKTLKEKSIYEPSRRSYNWLKIKKDYMQGMTDSLDLVPIGAWYGKGKRTGTYGAYLLACYDEDNEEFQTLCKIGTGFSDEQLTQFTQQLKSHVINQPRNMYRISDSIKPDVWLSPSQVWEVLAADLSISPVHTAAFSNLESNKGIALRFPRFIRIRDDKNPEDATSSDQVVLMYQNQKINNLNSNSNSKQQNDEDY